MHNRFNGMGSSMFFMWSIPLLLLLVIGLSLYMIGKNSKQKRESSETALDLLDRRYANSEIDEEEYLQRKKNLQQSKQQ